jgi:hypothetical protein
MSATAHSTSSARVAATGIEDDRHLLLRIVEEAYRQSTFNGTNLRTALDRISPQEAGWRPPMARHTIAEIAVHSAYWKFATRKRMTADRNATFPLKGEDWFDVERPLDADGWAGVLAVLDEEHAQLVIAIRRTERNLRFGTRTGRELVRKIFGVAMHDAYHTGQVHLIQAQFQRANERNVTA